MFLPTTQEEVKQMGWDGLDVILVSGDTYIDSSYSGISVIGHVLADAGFRVGVIAQPDLHSPADITRLGEPLLYWGVSAGCVDSMVANYTALRKKRRTDDFTPGGENTRRPDRASIGYANLIREYFKQTRPIVLGGVEASLRRIAHYDYWNDKVRKSVLFDAKADVIVYGMGERAALDLAWAYREGHTIDDIRGICYIAKQPREHYLELPNFAQVSTDKEQFRKMFTMFYRNNDPLTARGLVQQYDNRYLIQNPPAFNPTEQELDRIYGLAYERDVHPYYKKLGTVRALNTIRYSVTTHRGCYGECNFCAIAVHQGRTIVSRSEASIVHEIESMTQEKDFKGYISDVGGPTANMYGFECEKKITKGSCPAKRCIFPTACDELPISHERQVDLLKKIRGMRGVRKAFVASGLRYEMILQDDTWGERYLDDLVEHHVSGQLKIAPEHISHGVLAAMGKPANEYLEEFKRRFDALNERSGKKQFLTYYLIAAHPGCDLEEMEELKRYATQVLEINPEQVQIFTPTPSTYSTLMYYTETDPFTGKPLFVEKNDVKKDRQKQAVTQKDVGHFGRRPRGDSSGRRHRTS
ncbi:MAG TPA: YgiQ family radical SAM protein [Bacteroidota bacterium]|nr:YgiQ family radical SAM protein [Bacteroidota bacterium]